MCGCKIRVENILRKLLNKMSDNTLDTFSGGRDNYFLILLNIQGFSPAKTKNIMTFC